MPGYDPFLLCDFHVHTRWSDGQLTIGDVVDLYGQTRRFDVIAITDGEFSVKPSRFPEYLEEIDHEASRAKRLYDLLVIPGAEVTQHPLRRRKNFHIVALNIREYIRADQPADEILDEIRRQGGVSFACDPNHRTGHVDLGTCFQWNHRQPLTLYSWKTLLRCEKNWLAIAAAIRANVDVALTLDATCPPTLN
jgi:3',5'-nucleoside bisphosphate phosphatase